MDNKTLVVVVVVGIGAAAIAVYLYRRSGVNNFARLSNDARDVTDAAYRPGFLPSDQGPHFEGMPPSLTVENAYHATIAAPVSDGGCGGDYADIECRQKAYLKAMKAGTTDKADLICFSHHPQNGGTEDEYYGCLDGIYGNHQWLDRFAGNETCVCPPTEAYPRGTMGTYYATPTETGCFCPGERQLLDRRPVDQRDQIAEYVR